MLEWAWREGPRVSRASRFEMRLRSDPGPLTTAALDAQRNDTLADVMRGQFVFA